MSYAEELRNSELLAEMPFEYRYRNQTLDVFLNRLLTERNLFAGDVMPSPQKVEVIVSLIVLVDQHPDQRLNDTLKIWCLQSCPHIECVLVAATDCLLRNLTEWTAGYVPLTGTLVVCSATEWSICVKGHYLVFARPGDIIHPSVATALGTMLVNGGPDIVVWNTQHVSGDNRNQVTGFLRHPRLEIVTLRHVNYIGLSFAVVTEKVASYSGDLIDEVDRNGCHLFHLWLASDPNITWHTHPEYFTLVMRDEQIQSQLATFDPFKNAYRSAFLGLEGEFEFLETCSDAQPYYLRPKKRAKSISVIIPFRDKPEHTLKCLKSVFTQVISGGLEVILVDNCSARATLSRIDEFVRAGNLQGIIKLVHYQKPFNHSRQCNYGIEKSQGDVVVLLNNDAELIGEGVLDDMVAWALQPGVATVGCRIVAQDEQLVSAGIKARLNPGFDYNSAWEESKDARFSRNIRECFANTFACSAISRTVLNDIGPLNDMEFPNGYNDLEFCLRARSAGLRHLYLGQHTVRHMPGTSRGKCDELYQKLLLRERFPETFRDSLFQLESETRSMKQRVGLKHTKGDLKGVPVAQSKPLRFLKKIGFLERILHRG